MPSIDNAQAQKSLHKITKSNYKGKKHQKKNVNNQFKSIYQFDYLHNL